MPNAVIYARYSSHNQTEQSIEGQLHDAHGFAEKNGYTVIGEYVDRALTGTRDARPDFQRMIKDAEKRQFSVVIVWKLDRFARNRYDSAIYKAKLKKCGVRVVSVMENITDSPEGIILEGLLEAMAEYYSANLSENVRRGQQESIAKGQFVGGVAPFGYRQEGTRLVEDERSGPVIRELFRRYADGERLADIARDFNARGLRTATGRLFTCHSFDTMLTNRSYLGEYSFSGHVLPDFAPALVDQATFDRAVQRRAPRRRAPAAGRSPMTYLLQGKLYCGLCGEPMTGECGRSKTGVYYYYYKCAGRKHKKNDCAKKAEKKDFLEWYVCEQAVQYILDAERLPVIARAVAAVYADDTDERRAAELQRTADRLDRELEKLVDSLIDLPTSARPRIAERMGLLEAQKADAEADLAKLRMQQRIRVTEKEVAAWLRTFARGDLMDADFRQRVIDDFVNSVYLYEDKIVIFFNLRHGQETVYLDPDTDPIDPAALTPVNEKNPRLKRSTLTGEARAFPPKVEPQPPYLIFIRGVPGIVIPR